MIDSTGKNCSRCGACVQICPAACISMQANGSGDLCARVDPSSCLRCDACETHCHLLGEVPFKQTIKAYAAWAAENPIRQASASGGAFAALADAFLKKGGVVFGCRWQADRWRAVHTMIEDVKDLELLQGSKYVESSTESCYSQAREALRKGRRVLYSGTPCQIAGLYRYLGKDYENLTTVDLVCHGVPAEHLFEEYMAFFERKHHCRVLRWNFRSHQKGRQGYFGLIQYEKRGASRSVPLLWNCDSYYDCFMNAVSYRELCYTCRYAQRSRVGDITLGDFWGIENVIPGMVAGNISLVLANSAAGASLVESCEGLLTTQVDIETACSGNGQLNAPVEKLAEGCRRFWELYRQGGWEAVDQDFRRRTRLRRLKAYAVYYTPQWVKKTMRKIRR